MSTHYEPRQIKLSDAVKITLNGVSLYLAYGLYILSWFTGVFGLHRLYARKFVTGALQLVASIAIIGVFGQSGTLAFVEFHTGDFIGFLKWQTITKGAGVQFYLMWLALIVWIAIDGYRTYFFCSEFNDRRLQYGGNITIDIETKQATKKVDTNRYAELKKAAELWKKGHLNDDEYQAIKARCLAS